MSIPSSAFGSPPGNASPAVDLGPLAWVLGEIQKTLDGVSKTLRRFSRESAGSPDIDTAPLRMARHQLHQAVGALQMVGHAESAQVLGAMEFAVQSFSAEPIRCTEAAVQKIERAGFAVADFLNALLAGKTVSSVALFPQYRDVLELVGNERIHPADLWSTKWRWVEIRPAPTQPALVYDPAVRSKLDREVLNVVKNGDDHASRRLHSLCLGLARGASVPRVTSFWMLAAGFFEALSLSLVPADSHVKRAASRVLLQYTTLARGDNTVSDRLGQDLLFFCAQAVPDVREEAPTLRAVRLAWGVADEEPIDYATEQFGRFDPLMLAQARKRIESAKEMWSALSGGDVHRIRQVADSFAHLGESLQKIHPPSQPMVHALNKAVDASMQSGRPPGTELSMEVATAVLYLEAAFEDLDPQDRQLTARTVQLAGRIDRVRNGGRSEPLEPWMEELYRKVSDRQTMGTVVGELRSHLAELEKSLDQFFRRPAEKSLLGAVPTQLMQMRGVFSVLGLDQAAQTVQRMREEVDHLLGEDGLDAEAQSYDSLGNNLGALGFLIDMLGYQPALAKRLFVFDADAGELKPLMGRQGEAAQADASTPADPTFDLPQERTTGEPSVEEVDAQIAAKLAALGSTPRGSAPPADPAPAPASWKAKITGPAPLEPLPDTEVTELEEDDLQNIFLDEAREVLHNGLAAIAALTSQPADTGELTVLRRAFHTLKGSSRMVGLMDFGDAAWAFEQVLNTWLADQNPATPELLAGTGSALKDFAKWVEAIAGNEPHNWQSAPFRSAAEALRSGEPIAPAVRVADEAALELAARRIAADETPVPVAPPSPLPMPDLPSLDLIPATVAASAAQAKEESEPSARPETDDDFIATDFLDFDGRPASPGNDSPAPIALEDIDFLETVHSSIEPSIAAPPNDRPPELAAGAAAAESRELDLSAGAPAVPAVPVEPESTDSADRTEPVVSEDGATPGAPLEEAPTFARTDEEAAADARALLEFLHGESAPEPVLRTEEEMQAEEVRAEEVQVQEGQAEVGEAEDVEPPLPETIEAESAIEPVVESEAIEEEQPEPPVADEQIKVIGPLSIGVALYNVYLVEADDWSQQLRADVEAWALDPKQRLAESTIGLAHSLAGSSATVGFQSLSAMARLLEAALQHLRRQGQGTKAQGAVLVTAAEEVRRLLHQFAAGFLKEPSADILQALRELAASISPFDEDANPADRTARQRSDVADVSLGDSDDDFDVSDAVDLDLFPIFEEEAAELLPQLGGALREWSVAPEQAAPRASILRTLHTLKGSARLAGAMRLGELAHRMESEVEQISNDGADRPSIERLLARFDVLQLNFDSLREADRVAQAAIAQRASDAVAATKLEEAVPQDAAAEAIPPIAEALDDVSDAQPVLPSERKSLAMPLPSALTPSRAVSSQVVRIRTQLLDRLVAQAGEVMITRSRLEAELAQLRSSLTDLTGNLDRLRQQLRDIEVQAESQMQSRLAQAKDSQQGFDPLEFDRFTRVQELTRMMAESVNDVATVQRTLQKTVQSTEDDLSAQARQTRELQRGLLRTRMVEFEGISERLYRVVRQASKDTGKQVRLDITGGTIEMDRGVLDRMMPAFEHLLRNSVAHGIESASDREKAGKDASGLISIDLHHEGNDVSVSFTDDGAGLNRKRIVDRAVALGLVARDQHLEDDEVFELIMKPGFSTAEQISELAGRGIGM
ncbi:MAG: Hpt domain-containing protein, partial [Gammaproteobacteria bacterium]|nr:Hpt domain-containing protein [Gammaproteobacteria bacterium]MBU1439980.1 Hpt domain-containing protein [Gammaproteobacteria bacterium]